MAYKVTTTELRTPLTLITPLGLAEAHFFIESGRDGVEWGCFQKDTGEFWLWPNREVRLQRSLTEYRDFNTPIVILDPVRRQRIEEHRQRIKKAKEDASNSEAVPRVAREGQEGR